MRPTRRTQPHRRGYGRRKTRAVRAMLRGRSRYGTNRADAKRAYDKVRPPGRRRRRKSSVR